LLSINSCMLIIPMPPFSTPNMLPIFYKICIQSWSKLQELIQLCNNDIDSILKTRIFCNSSITFKNKPLGLSKVTLRSGTIVVSPFKTFMNFSGISFFILENPEIQFLLSINKLYIS
jgi:hypothetical protein